MYKLDIDINRSIDKLYDKLYHDEFKRYNNITKNIPNHYLFAFLALQGEKKQLTSDEESNLLFKYKEHYSNVNIVNNQMVWDWSLYLPSKGIISYSNPKFNFKDLFNHYNYFLIQGEVFGQSIYIRDFITRFDFFSNRIFITRYFNNDKYGFPYLIPIQNANPVIKKQTKKIIKYLPIAYHTVNAVANNQIKPVLLSEAFFKRKSDVPLFFRNYSIIKFFYKNENKINYIGISSQDFTSGISTKIIRNKNIEKKLIEYLETKTKGRMNVFIANEDFNKIAVSIISMCYEHMKDFEISKITYDDNKIMRFSILFKRLDFKDNYAYPDVWNYEKEIRFTSIFGLIPKEIHENEEIEYPSPIEICNHINICKESIRQWQIIFLYYSKYFKEQWNTYLYANLSLPQLSKDIWLRNYVTPKTFFQNESPLFIHMLNNVNKSPYIITTQLQSKYKYDINKFYSYLNMVYEYPAFVIKREQLKIGQDYKEYIKESDFFGFAQCTITPPNHPLQLPLFEKEDINGFQGTFFTEELKYALELGYSITIYNRIIYAKFDDRIGKDPVKEYITDLYKQSKNKKLYKKLSNYLLGLLYSKKSIIYNTKLRRDLKGHIPIESTKYSINVRESAIPLTLPMGINSSRYLATIAYGRIHIHKLILKYNIEYTAIHTDGFSTNKELPNHLLGSFPGQLRQC